MLLLPAVIAPAPLVLPRSQMEPLLATAVTVLKQEHGHLEIAVKTQHQHPVLFHGK